MRKKWMVVLTMTTMVTAGSMLMAGCGDDAATGANSGEPGTEAAGTEIGNAVGAEESETGYTVTFYDSDGTTVLDTAKVKEGECATEYKPQKDGYIFAGWFGTPQMTHRFDFAEPIKSDTKVFAGFVSYVEDAREYAIVGGGTSPVLIESNWGEVINSAQKMTKQESKTDNIYTITLDLNQGDTFQFATDTSWGDQRGYGYLDTITKDGTDYFENAGSLGEASTKRSNIKCAVSGNYTFTLTTYPGEDTYETDNAQYTEEKKHAFNINPYDTLTWTYNGVGDTASVDSKTDYYIKGAQVTGWEDVYSDQTEFQEQDGIYSLSVALAKGDEFMFTSMITVGENKSAGTEFIRYSNIAPEDTESLSFVKEGNDSNLIAAAEGNYTFVYDPATKILTVTMK